MEWMLLPLKRYADFSGRSRRTEYWMWILLQFIIYIGVLILSAIFGGAAMMMSGDPNAIMAAAGPMFIVFLLYMLWELAILIPSLAVTVRRLHDTNRSGWWILAPLGPYLIAFITLFGAAASGSQGSEGGLAVMGIIGIVAVFAALGLALALLVFMFLEGTRGPNKYGPDPKGENTGQAFA